MLNLNTAPLSALVAEFNKLTGQSIKKFSDRKTAIKRLSAVLPKQTKSAKFGKTTGIGVLAKALIAKQLPQEEILAKVKESFPHAKTTVKCLAFYRKKMKASGELRA